MTMADGIQIALLLVTAIGVWLAYRQLSEVSKSISLARQGNTVNSIAHCASRYETVISMIPKEDNLTCEEKERWWYLYWDLWTEEFNFFSKGLLDPDIFELWVNELVTAYQKYPRGCQWMGTYSDKHKDYLRLTLPSYWLLHEFFEAVDFISQEQSAGMRAQSVHTLVDEFSKKISRLRLN